ncbi:hypothetical protein C8T65DRAFT_630847 [Cerioporus squamosus]|nr:hypothetical protein C8T65DRAFT_630847 [Cerioporus squamosus]
MRHLALRSNVEMFPNPTIAVFSSICRCSRLPPSIPPSATHLPLQNLQRYVQEAVLPVLTLDSLTPGPSLKSDIHVLSLGSEGRKGPDYVHLLETFLTDATQFTSLNVPNQPIDDFHYDPHDQRFLTIPSSDFPDFLLHFGDTSALHGLVMWVMLYPLQSVRCLLQLCHPLTAHLDLHTDCDENGSNSPLIQWVRFGPSVHREEDELVVEKSSVTVFVLAPWMFSNEDLEAFTEACPDFLESSTHVPNNAERLWAKMRDVCQDNGSRFFVLTTYCGWVFGAFSEGRGNHAWVSGVISGYSKGPTILECLFYWIASATGCTSQYSFQIPAEAWSWDEEGHLQVHESRMASSCYYVDPCSDDDLDEDGMNIDGGDEFAYSVQCSSIEADDDMRSRKHGGWGFSDDAIRTWDRDVHAVRF